MSADRELLELAAKAAGLVPDTGVKIKTGHLTVTGEDVKQPFFWNPLTDDGDALRLAVKLGLRFCAAGNGGNVSVVGHSFDALGVVVMPNNDDPYAATRRAIVRAAAEIGRSKE